MKTKLILSLTLAIFLANSTFSLAQSCANGAYNFSDITAIFQAEGCTGCHGSQGGLNLTNYTNVINGGNFGAGGCGPYTLPVDLLLAKVDGTLGSGCGNPMPPGTPQGTPGMSAANIQALQSWISAGAPLDCPAPINCTNNPSVQAGSLTPAPLVSGQPGVLSFTYVENFFDYTDDENNPVKLTLCLLNIAPINGTTSIGGTFASTFNWVFDPSSNCFQGTQNQDILGGSGGTITVDFNLVNEIACPTNQTGFTVNIQPAPCMVTSNNTTDDFESVFACVACTNTAVVIESINISCNGANDGEATASLSNGTAPFTYVWNNGGSTTTINGLTPGTYMVTVSDSDGCSETGEVTITEPPILTVSGTETNVTCNDGEDGSIDITVSGGTVCSAVATELFISEYIEGSSNNKCIEIFNGTGAAVNLSSYGIDRYSNGSASSSATYTFPSVMLANNDVYVVCNPSSSSVFLGLADATSGVLSFNGDDAVVLTNNNVNVDIFGNIGCDPGSNWSAGGNVTSNSTLTRDANVLMGVTVDNTTSCPFPTLASEWSSSAQDNSSGLGSHTFGAGGGYEYSWSNSATTEDLTGLSAGTYTVTVSDCNGCEVSETFTITEPSELTIQTEGTNASCNDTADGTATATPAGGTAPYTYAWSNMQTTAMATGLTAGSYTVTVTDSNMCTITGTVIITAPSAITVQTEVTNISCNGAADGTATATPAGGTSPYTYAWNNMQTTAMATGLAAGSYTVTVTDANMCAITGTVTITEPSAITVQTEATNISCNGAADGTATATPTGGTSSYTYAWNNMQTTAMATGLVAGSYTVTVTDANMCTITGTVTLTEPTELTVEVTGTDTFCESGSDGTASATPAGGTSPYTYAWNNMQTTAMATGLTAGTYTVTVTDANMCTVIGTVMIAGSDPINITMTSSSVSCNGGTDGTATATPSGGVPPYSYSWVNGQTTQTATPLVAGDYTVTVSDSNGCTSTGSVTVTEADALSIQTSGTDVNCAEGEDGTTSVAPTGGTPPYSYLWSDGQTIQTATGLTAGTYTLTLTDSNGCIALGIETITEPTELKALMTPMNISCSGGTNGAATATPTGGVSPYSYLWNNGHTTQVTTGLAAGIYSVTLTDANECTTISFVTIEAPEALVTQTSGTTISCNKGTDGTATTSPSGGTAPYTYAWNNMQTTAMATGLMAGTYTITVSDANMCTTTGTVTLTEPDAITVQITNTNVSCNGGTGGTADAMVSGGTPPYNYAWSSSQNGPLSQMTKTVTGLSSGTYTITVTDASECTSTGTVTITEPSALSANVTGLNIACNGSTIGSAMSSPTGGTSPYSYSWNNGETTSGISGLNAGTYSVTVTDANMCTATGEAELVESSALSILLTPTLISCNGQSDGTIDATVSGGETPYTYTWSNSATTASISGLGAGTYSVQISDSNGCTGGATIVLVEPDPLAVQVTSSNVTCNGGSDGTANAGPITGGTAPYTYNWNNGQTNSTTTGLTSGTYTVTVTDSNNCSGTGEVTITEPDAITLQTSSTSVLCSGGSNGSATVIAAGGTAPYTYNWNAAANGQTSSTASMLTAGMYTVTVTDNAECIATASVTVTESDLLSVSIEGTNISCSGSNNGMASATATGGTSPYFYSWSNGAVTQAISGLIPGIYTITVSDVNECIGTASVEILDGSSLSVTALANSVICNGGTDGFISTMVAGGQTPYTYTWSAAANGQTSATATGLSAGTYEVTVVDAAGCSGTASATVTEPDLLSVALSITGGGCGATGEATATATGGTSPYSYNWSNGQTSSTATGLVPGTYMVTVSDANECETVGTITVSPTASLAITVTTVNVTCNGLSDGSATAMPSGGTSPYTYNWSNGQSTEEATGLAAGSYVVTVIDATGCSGTAMGVISEPNVLSAQIAGGNTTCFGASDGTATAFANGGTSPYTYQWNSSQNGPLGQSTVSITGLTSGDYTLTVTDENACMITASVSILDGAALTLGLTGTDVTCGSSSDGTASVSVTGGDAPYSYEWNDGQTNANATGLIAGNYTVTVTDSNGCSSTGVISINEDQTSIAVQISSTDVSCNGDSDGTAQATATGGTTPYSYSWSTGETSSTISNLSGGTYTLTVTDNNGCSGTGMATIIVPGPLDLGLSHIDISCGIANTGSASTAVTGGTPPFTYSWSNGAMSSSITSLATGIYDVTVTDANGCSETGSVSIDDSGALQVTILGNDITCTGNANGDATAMPQSGTSPYDYNWSNGSTTAMITGLTAGTYTVSVSDMAGCTGTADVTIIEPGKMTSVISIQEVSCGGLSDGSATVLGSNGTMPYVYQWDASAGNQTSSTATGLMEGTYTVSITDANGCSTIASLVVGKEMCSLCDDATNSPSGICGILTQDPNDPIGTEDCDNGGIDNATECANGGDPNDPLDDCQSADTAGVDICLLINGNPTHPLATADCDNGGISNIEECTSNKDPFDPSDDCQTALDEQLNICMIIAYDPSHPLASSDCDNGGVDNFTECTNGGDPTDPNDDCEAAVEAGLDICVIIAGGNHPWASLDCDNGGVSNDAECATGGDPSNPADDNSCPIDICEEAIEGNVDICAVILSNPNHPLATADCDNGGIDNATECANSGDPLEASDDCAIADIASVDICLLLADNPMNPIGTVDCDNGGVDNATECASNNDPNDPSDDCEAAIANGVNICKLINYDPNHPLAALDCDNGGIDNYTECMSGEDPSEPSDDCQTVIDEDIEICSIITGSNGNHPLATLDCDNGGVDNAHECQHQTDTNEPSDDCQAAVLCALDICALIDGDPNHPLADQDCDNGGVSNWEECQNGGSPIDPSDDCNVAIAGGADICMLINFDPNHPMASLDCDNGGVSNYDECMNGGDPSDPTDDCATAVIVGTDICAVLAQNPTSSIGTADCDNGGVNNADECANNGDPLDPADDCGIAASNGQDVCLIINGDPNHPIASLDCDNGGVDNYTECENGADPTDSTDDCQGAIDGGLDICLLINYNTDHPLASLDCDNGGIDNFTECTNAGDPADSADDCQIAVIAGTDICAILDSTPNHPWATLDCDRGGVDNQTECAAGTDPSVPSDDQFCPPTLCEDAEAGIIDICMILDGNPNHPVGTLDCDNGGVDNATECANGGNPIDDSDDCSVMMDNGLDLCALINGDVNHPLASVDCDGGGILNITECNSGENPSNPTDDCQAAINSGINICQVINFDPTHPMATQDCDDGGVDNYTECMNGGDPSIASDDCDLVLDGEIDVCILLDNNPNSPLGTTDCDGDGVTNVTECSDGTDPTDQCDFTDTSITLPVTADQSNCPGLCPDLTPITTILPGNIAGVSFVGVAVQISELNGITTDGSTIRVRIPSDPRFIFTWNPTLTSVALTPVSNIDWTYNGNSGIFHEFQYNGLTGAIPGGGLSSFGFAGTYDPQATDGQTTVTATIFPFSGGECNILNNTDSERLVYFE